MGFSPDGKTLASGSWDNTIKLWSTETFAEIRQLSGLLNKSGDTGLFVSSGGFTPDAVEAIRNAAKHIEKIDLDSFIDLWEQYFDKMDEEDQARLPLRRIAFLAPQE